MSSSATTETPAAGNNNQTLFYDSATDKYLHKTATQARSLLGVAVVMTGVGGRGGTLAVETAVTTKTQRWYNRSGSTITFTAFYASVDTAPTGSAITVAVRKNSAGANDSTITISAAANTGSQTGLSLSVADGDYLQIWPTAVGSTVAGTDLVVLGVGTS
jgi:hypothetical protein